MKTKHAALGFTLIELLTVIAIIAILISLLAPALVNGPRQARKLRAQNDLKQILGAVSAFYTDYGVYPLPPGTRVTGTGASSNYTYGDPSGSGAQSTNNYLFDVLRAFQGDSATASAVLSENPRLTAYLDVQYVTNPANPKSGITTQPGGSIPAYCYVDPWGMPYNVRIDASYSNQVYFNPPYTNPSLSVNYLNVGVIVWSYGPDRTPGAGGNGDITSPNFDDILSWR